MSDGSLAPTTPAKKAATPKVNGSGTGGRKRKKAGVEDTINGNGIKMENGAEASSDDIDIPTKKVKTEDGEDAGATNGAAKHNGEEAANGVGEDEAQVTSEWAENGFGSV